ncbi:MAG: TldD/PmbA family protein [Candidatus Thorarchaeota archaeon]|jgi:PmbA protein
MTDEKQLLELCKYIVKSGIERGADAIEVLAQGQSQIDTDVELAQISSVNKSIATEIAIRLFVGKRMGSSFTNIPTHKAADEALELAINAAKVTTADKDWISFPKPQEYSTIEGLWDDSVTKTDSSKVVEMTGELVAKAMSAEDGLMVTFGASGALQARVAYANSNGVEHAERGTGAWIVLGAIAQLESGVTPSIFSYDIRRGLGMDMDGTVEDLVSMIRLCKTKVDGKSGKRLMIFHPFAYSQIMNFTLLQSIRGDNVARGKSKIGDKIGDTVASEKVSIYDDGTIPRGMGTSIADDEGVPRQKTAIIEKGVLRSFLWDTYWANKVGVKSTGNARRNMRQGLVEISTTNLVVEPGDREIQDIIAEVKDGYYIRNVQGAHSSNPESGDFSIVGNPAIHIKDGKMVGQVEGLMISGNIYELLENVVEVAKTPHYLQAVIAPEIIVQDVSVVAKE